MKKYKIDIFVKELVKSKLACQGVIVTPYIVQEIDRLLIADDFTTLNQLNNVVRLIKLKVKKGDLQ